MRLRSFTAKSMPAAIEMVRQELGEHAIIVASEPLNGKAVKVTAAVEEQDEELLPPKKSAKSATDYSGDLRFTLQNTLRFHNLPELFISKMMLKISDRDLAAIARLVDIGGKEPPARAERMALEKLLAQVFSFRPLHFDEPPLRIMLAGAPGTGKTFTIAKIASRLAMQHKPFTVITTDNKRAGGIEQLKAYTDILQAELLITASPKALAKELAALPEKKHVLIDTAGCNAYDKEQMAELAVLAGISGVEPVLVMAAGGDSLEAIDTLEPFAELPITRMLVTRADTARRFGGVLAAAAAYGFSFTNISVSSSITDNLQPADAPFLAQLLLQYQLQS